MNPHDRDATRQEDEIDIIGAGLIVWRRKYLVGLITLIMILLALFIALTATPIFRSEVLVTPVHDTGAGGMSSLLGQVGGLASLAGLNLGGLSGEDTEHEATLESRRLVEEFLKKDDVLATFTRGLKEKPSLWIAVEKFRKNVLTIHEDKITNLTTVTVDWTDPSTASRWANEIVALANELIRARARDDASRNVAYLNKQLEQTNVVEIQRALYELIEQETKRLMLANGRVEYAFTVVDPAVTPEVRVSPKRTLIVLGGAFLGVLLGSFIVIVLHKIRQRATYA